MNWKFQGKTAVHMACTECYVECLKLLMTYHPDLELLVRVVIRLSVLTMTAECVSSLVLLHIVFVDFDMILCRMTMD